MSARGTTIKARATRFDLSSTPSHWIPGQPYATHVLDMTHAVLPPAERWFVDVYREALPYITDPALRADVEGFIAQETTHAKAHDRGLEHLARHGIDVRREVQWVDGARARVRARAKRLPQRVQRRLLYGELAAIAAGEHYTAFLGEWILDSPQLDLIGTDAVMLDLLRWHGAEEVEHRSVAFDAYQHIHGGYPLRVVSGTLMSVGLLVLVFGTAARLAARSTQRSSVASASATTGRASAPAPSLAWARSCGPFVTTCAAAITPPGWAAPSPPWRTSPAPRASSAAAPPDPDSLRTISARWTLAWP